MENSHEQTFDINAESTVDQYIEKTVNTKESWFKEIFPEEE